MSSDYIDRKVAEKAFARFSSDGDFVELCWLCLSEIPAADVWPVVLCKDCRHRDPEDHKCDCGQLERAGCVFPVDDDYFCAYGER